ncbi:alpha/beta hydrolase [Lacibacter sp. MH-610]|uniref:alpha/beta fold hydrolase n=1 Tax=Lacibacter sp. MH-610 TaxID=3020883 RepID=UPI003891D054
MQEMISYKIYGAGAPVLLIHGFGEDSRIWNHQIDFLKTSCQLIVPDLRGSGASAALPPPGSIEQMAEDILQILNEERTEVCTVIGHSMGGYIALALMEKYPHRFHALGLIHSTAYADNEEKKQARLKSIEFIQQNSAYEFIKATIPNLFADKFKQEHTGLVAELIEQGRQFSKEVLIGYYTAMINRPARTTLLQQTNKPVLFFIGSEDKAVNPADALQQASLPAITMIKYIEEIAHMGMWEATSVLNRTLEEFLQLVQQINRPTALSNSK